MIRQRPDEWRWAADGRTGRWHRRVSCWERLCCLMAVALLALAFVAAAMKALAA